MATKLKGYMGRLLRVNLSDRTVIKEELNREWARDYIGGSGLGIRYAYAEVPPETDPTGEQAKLYFFTGPVTGTLLGTSGRYQIIFKSPLTELLCDSSSSGYWGAELKQAGYDGIVIEGKSDKPVYLWINNEKAEIKDASAHWGKDTERTQRDLLEETGDNKARVACIGIGGENGALYAGVINDEGRAAARGGGGTVMGSKRLKAIVVRGTGSVETANPEKFHELAVAFNKKNAEEGAGFGKVGTISVHDDRWPISDIPVKNWSEPSCEELCTPLGGNNLLEIMPRRTNSCFGCPIRCARWVKIEHGPYAFEGPGPEYESSAALGTLCMNINREAMCYANHLCNLYGLDTISTGATLAFTMECYEKGYLKKEDLDGMELRWGNAEGMMLLIEKIAKQEGAGKFLGLGTRRMAERIGRDSADFAVHVKGLELPMHDPRTRFSWASTYATATRGGCHLKGMSDTWEDATDPLPEWGVMGPQPSQQNTGKAVLTRYAQVWGHLRDSLVVCHFATTGFQPSLFSNLLTAATGRETSVEELVILGDRINNLHRAYNNRCGITREDDTLPKRVMTPLKGGGADGLVPDLEGQLLELYAIKGWERDGKPSRKTLEALGLGFAADDLYGAAAPRPVK